MKKVLLLIISTLFINITCIGQEFIRRNGDKLFLGDEEIHLRGMSFGNRVWENIALPSGHHNESDIARVNKMGMNAIRFYLNYVTFENDASPYVYKQAGWDWLDQNIAWAKKHNVYLILNMHVPQGGFQSQCNGEALWKIPSNQDRFVNLWKNIAQRYANEPQIAGLDLLNEPTPSDSVISLQHLLQRTIDSIRTVDNNHLIIAERALALGCDYGYNDGKYNYPELNEDNLMYTVHIYEPYEYTHQNLVWANTGDGGSYPDEDKVSVPADLTWGVGQYNNPLLPAGTTDWTFSQGLPFLVSEDRYVIARPVFYGHKLGAGVAFYDDITVNEVDAQGNIISEIMKVNFKDNKNIWFWSEKNDGTLGGSTSGHGDQYALTNTGTSGNSSIIAGGLPIKVEKGKRYAITGWMKGTNIPVGATVSITLELYYSPSGSPVLGRNKEYLESIILKTSEYPVSKGFPVYFGEFGVAKNAFQNDKGGERWTKDVLDIFQQLGYNWTYHVYREPSFGLYEGVTGAVDTNTVNTLLLNTFKDHFEKVSSINDALHTAGIDLYPNPSSDMFHMVLPHTSSVEIGITDLAGNQIFEKKYSNENTITFGENLRSGFYLCKVKIDGRAMITKICKE